MSTGSGSGDGGQKPKKQLQNKNDKAQLTGTEIPTNVKILGSVKKWKARNIPLDEQYGFVRADADPSFDIFVPYESLSNRRGDGMKLYGLEPATPVEMVVLWDVQKQSYNAISVDLVDGGERSAEVEVDAGAAKPESKANVAPAEVFRNANLDQYRDVLWRWDGPDAKTAATVLKKAVADAQVDFKKAPAERTKAKVGVRKAAAKDLVPEMAKDQVFWGEADWISRRDQYNTHVHNLRAKFAVEVRDQAERHATKVSAEEKAIQEERRKRQDQRERDRAEMAVWQERIAKEQGLERDARIEERRKNFELQARIRVEKIKMIVAEQRALSSTFIAGDDASIEALIAEQVDTQMNYNQGLSQVKQGASNAN